MKFFENIKNSIYSPRYYREIISKSFWLSYGYFSLFILLLTIVQVALLTPKILDFQNRSPGFIDQLVGYFPNELEIMIHEGKASTNVSEPYYIPIPETDLMSSDSPMNLIVIDTKTPFSASQFNKYKTVVWLAGDSLFYKSDSQIRAFDLTQIQEDFLINKQLVEGLADLIKPYISYLTPVLLAGAFLGIYLWHNSTLFYLLLLAIVVLIISKIARWGLSYGQAYKASMHAATLGLLLNFLQSVAQDYVYPINIPFLFTISSLVIIYLNLKDLSDIEKPPSPPAPTT